MEAIKQDGNALWYASERMQDDETIVLEAMKDSVFCGSYASKRLKTAYSFIAQGIMGCDRESEYFEIHDMKEFINSVLKPMFPTLQVVKVASTMGSHPVLFTENHTENQGKDAANLCVHLFKTYSVERIWLLSQVCRSIPATIVKSINALW
jgi:hypothetical protein